jgi:hypothetical protein
MAGSKPEFIVFYAWQSDRPSGRNRYFIQKAATEAAAKLTADSSCGYAVRIDQDTTGEPGLCDIPATILKRIDNSDAFLCDLTYVAESGAEDDAEDFEPRLCSNPNVLFELGYAFKSMGPERIVCVMNEKYGPVASQIFDLAHRRFPIAYRLPNENLSNKQVEAGLVDALVSAIRGVIRLGARSATGSAERIRNIRRTYEEQIRQGEFNGLYRPRGAIAIAVIPGPGTHIENECLDPGNVWPPGAGSWDTRNRGNAVVTFSERAGMRYAAAELRNDGVILVANTFMLGSLDKEAPPYVPGAGTEKLIISSVSKYLEVLRTLEAFLPWTICVSLLEIKGYWLYVRDGQTSDQMFEDTDIHLEPIVLENSEGSFDFSHAAQILRPAFDFIWREFGFERSYNYTESGLYNVR